MRKEGRTLDRGQPPFFGREEEAEGLLLQQQPVTSNTEEPQWFTQHCPSSAAAAASGLEGYNQDWLTSGVGKKRLINLPLYQLSSPCLPLSQGKVCTCGWSWENRSLKWKHVGFTAWLHFSRWVPVKATLTGGEGGAWAVDKHLLVYFQLCKATFVSLLLVNSTFCTVGMFCILKVPFL